LFADFITKSNGIASNPGFLVFARNDSFSSLAERSGDKGSRVSQ